MANLPCMSSILARGRYQLSYTHIIHFDFVMEQFFEGKLPCSYEDEIQGL